MAAAHYIGRVGGLAVALGIGVAIAQGAATASAQEDGAGPDTRTTVTKSAAGKSDDTTRVRPTRSGIDTEVRRLAERVTAKLTAPAKSAAASKPGKARAADLDRDPLAEPRRKLQRAATRAVTELRELGAPKSSGDGPQTPPRSLQLLTMAGAARQETATADSVASNPLATPDQLAAERRAGQIAKTPIVELTKVVLKVAWYISAQKNFALVGGPDKANLAQLNRSVDEYANQAAMEVQLLNPNNPKLLQQVMPPHTWYGQSVGGTRIWYDNPDTVYRFVAVNAASSYQIHGTYNPDAEPTDTNFSVLTGLNGDTASNLTWDQIDKQDGEFTITVGSDPSRNGERNYLYLPSNATLITTRNTLSDKDSQEAMGLTITRTSGPPDSLFAQIGGFLIPVIGPAITENPTLVKLVSIIPPFKNPPLILQASETALLMLILGITKQDEYIAVATKDPTTGQLRPPNTFTDPQYNAQFLSTQLQSPGYFQLTDDEALVLTIDPGNADYFIVPVTNDWTITGNPSQSINIDQATPNPDGTYTIVVSKNDPGVPNWVSTGGLNQGTISIRFQKLGAGDPPKVSSTVVKFSSL